MTVSQEVSQGEPRPAGVVLTPCGVRALRCHVFGAIHGGVDNFLALGVGRHMYLGRRSGGGGFFLVVGQQR